MDAGRADSKGQLEAAEPEVFAGGLCGARL